MKLIKFIVVISFFLLSCHKEEKNLPVDISNKHYYHSLTKDNGFKSANVGFNDKGATFSIDKESYLIIDSLKTINTQFNISCWFNYTGKDGTKTQTIFTARDTINHKNAFTFGVAGNRFTGSFNDNRYLWAKDYGFEVSKKYFDLFRLESGKYYFLSINFFEDTLEIYINAELYSEHHHIENKLNKHILYLGNEAFEGTFKNPLQGYIRNMSIYNRVLHKKEILKLSEEYYDEIFDYNDKFELSKFQLD